MRWVTFCRLFLVSEAVIAAALNMFVLILVWRRRIDANASTYRIGITVVCLSAIVQSLLQCFTITIHQIHDNVYALVQLGAVGWISEDAREVCAVATQTLIFLMWELIPASCILQYLALCRHLVSFSSTRRSGRPSSMTPSDKCREWQKTSPFMHTLQLRISFLKITIALSCRSFSLQLSYGAFVITTLLIYRALRTDGVQLTQKTLSMQRRFLRIQVLQGFVPLLVCGFPVALFIGNIIAGTSMDRLTILITGSIFAVPIVQALVSLTFVRRMKKKADSETSSSTVRRTSSKAVSPR